MKAKIVMSAGLAAFWVGFVWLIVSLTATGGTGWLWPLLVGAGMYLGGRWWRWVSP